MDQIITSGNPHIGEKIFGNLDSSSLLHCLHVSKTWRQIAEASCCKQMSGRAQLEKVEIVKLLIELENIHLVSKPFDGKNALMLSIMSDNFDIVKWIFANLKDPKKSLNSKDDLLGPDFMI